MPCCRVSGATPILSEEVSGGLLTPSSWVILPTGICFWRSRRACSFTEGVVGVGEASRGIEDGFGLAVVFDDDGVETDFS